MTGTADFTRNRDHLAAALAIAGALVTVRSASIAAAHSEFFDARYHVDRGLALLTGTLVERGLILNDPAFGEALLALPLAVFNLLWGRPVSSPWDSFYYLLPPGPEWFSLAIALWKSVLFLPFLAVVFIWCRRLYGLEAAWLAIAIVVVDPTIAAHIPVIALDVFGLEGIMVASFAFWTYSMRPTGRHAVAAGLATGLALSLKHTALFVPLAGTVLMLAYRWRSWRRHALPGATLLVLALTGILSLWACTLFDTKTPPLFDAPAAVPAAKAESLPPSARLAGLDQAERAHLKAMLRLRSPWPAGAYVHSLLQGLGHGAIGHPAYLLGEKSPRGWWYYQAVAATYKVPLGIAGVLLLGVLSFRWMPFRFDELSLLVPGLAGAAVIAISRLSIGFRHALPVYVFFAMLAVRCVAGCPRVVRVVAWVAVAAAALHATSFHPDYLSYFNVPRERPYLAISDSNVDSGQSLKQVRDWLDQHHVDDRPVTLGYFGQTGDRAMLGHYLGERVRVYVAGTPPPSQGTLIVSPVLVAGVYDTGRSVFAPLQRRRPDTIIGHCMLVYDLDLLFRESGPLWSAEVP